MNQKSYQALTVMLNDLNVPASDIRGRLLSYEEVLTGVSDDAIIEAALRFRQGVAPGQSLTFAPASAEFNQEARRVDAVIPLRNRPRLPAPVYTPGKMAPFEVAQQQAWTRNSDRPVIKENVSLEEWRRMSKAREVPTGAIWSACLGVVFGPAPKQQSNAKAA